MAEYSRTVTDRVNGRIFLSLRELRLHAGSLAVLANGIGGRVALLSRPREHRHDADREERRAALRACFIYAGSGRGEDHELYSFASLVFECPQRASDGPQR